MRPLLVLSLLALPSCNAITGIDAYETRALEGIPVAPDAREVDGAPIDTASDGAALDSGSETGPDAPPDSIGADTAIEPDTAAPCPTHSNGMGGTYVLCEPLGVPGNASTYTAAMAEAASLSWAPGAAVYKLGCTPPAFADNATARCRKTGTGGDCASWMRGGVAAGHVLASPDPMVCATLGDPVWN